MDLLYKRYASPYLLLDEMLEQKRLEEFIYELSSIKREEDQFNIWLHKIFDKDFKEWKDAIDESITPSNNEANLEAAIINSRDILKGFVPS